MTEIVFSKLATQIAQLSLDNAMLGAHKEEVESKLNQVLQELEVYQERIRGLEAENAELSEKLQLLTEGEVVE